MKLNEKNINFIFFWETQNLGLTCSNGCIDFYHVLLTLEQWRMNILLNRVELQIFQQKLAYSLINGRLISVI